MKKVLISFIRNEHLEGLNSNNHLNLDITNVCEKNSIDRIFLLTNQDREDSITFKSWISEKLSIEVKAVTLEKGSEKYILGKIESIIKYILLAEEGHASFFYLPGENTLQINLWEIVNKTIYNGVIIYPDQDEEIIEVQKTIPETPKAKPQKPKPSLQPQQERKNTKKSKFSHQEKLKNIIKRRANALIFGEEGSGKRYLAESVLDKLQTAYVSYNFRAISPSKLEEKTEEIVGLIEKWEEGYLLLYNIEILPDYIQEQLTDYSHIPVIATMNVKGKGDLDTLNKRFYYSISTNILALDPLRSRKEELPALVSAILDVGDTNVEVSEKAMSYLKNYNWPGNMNELRAVILRSAENMDGKFSEELLRDSLDTNDLDLEKWKSEPLGENFNLNELLGEVAMHYIMMALELCEGKKSKAAQMLGFSNYQTLSNWMKKYS